jgi:hypothetical protein
MPNVAKVLRDEGGLHGRKIPRGEKIGYRED